MDEELFVLSGFGVLAFLVAFIVAVVTGTWAPFLIIGGVAALAGAISGFTFFMLWLYDKIF